MTDRQDSEGIKKAIEGEYPCNECGVLRTKAEGGTTFTVCDECWDKAHPKNPNALTDIKAIEGKMREIIEKGDKVNIDFANGEKYIGAEVLHVSYATGDCWHIRTKLGNLVYVQSFETMTLEEER